MSIATPKAAERAKIVRLQLAPKFAIPEAIANGAVAEMISLADMILPCMAP